jgi:hypothetical protein
MQRSVLPNLAEGRVGLRSLSTDKGLSVALQPRHNLCSIFAFLHSHQLSGPPSNS